MTQDSAKVWFRGCPGTEVVVQFKESGQEWSDARSAGPAQVRPGSDYTAVVRLADLAAGTAYEYRLLVDGAPVAGAPEADFRTMPPGDGSRLSFIIGGDLHPQGEELVIFEQLAREEADFALLLGDLVDIEPLVVATGAAATPVATPTIPSPTSKRDYEALYRATWGDSHFRQFMAQLPTYMMWDDHEILNDWSGRGELPYPHARAAFREYVADANPDPVRSDQLYYTFRAGDAAFFVLDTRTFRNPGGFGDRAKTMLGAVQKAELKRWLLQSDATFKFIVSSVMWGNLARHRQEAWVNYREERDEIFNFIRDQQIRGVVLLSGDEHWNAVAHIQPWGLYEVAASPLGGAPFRQQFTNDPELLFKLGFIFAYGHYAVDATGCPATVNFRIIDSMGDVLHDVTLDELAISPGIAVSADDYCRARAQGRGDSDGDGCTDQQERGDDPQLGGARDPRNRWDFFDPDRSGTVDFADAQGVIDRLGAGLGDDQYDPAYDRGPRSGSNPWSLGPPDGAITADDLFALLDQFGHSCVTGPRDATE